MNIDDERWIKKWSLTPFRSGARNFFEDMAAITQRRYGTDQEPASSVRMASLSEGFGEFFREGVAVLDYGCGAGRYANFLKERLRTFSYFGLEQAGASGGHGEESITTANRLLGADSRIRFGFIGTALDDAAIQNAEVALLASIFTHLDVQETKAILRKLKPITDRGGIIVFTAFLDDTYHMENPGLYGFANFYNRVWLTTDQLHSICEENHWMLEERDSYVAQDANLHHVFAAKRKRIP